MRELYEAMWRENVNRPGVEEFLNWLAGTDFYTAPASSKYHLACAGGLVEHSINVATILRDRVQALGLPIPMASIVICGLGHDICKANYYTVEYRNRKNKQCQWEQYPFYAVKEKFPCGHGEKSVILLLQFMKLEPEEMLATRWHMGGFEPKDFAGAQAMSAAMASHPLVVLTHLADMEATYIKEAATIGA